MWKYTAADKRLHLLHSMWAFMCFIVNYVWWKARYIVTSPYGCRKWNCRVDVTFIAITGFVQPTSLQRWPPFGLIHLLKRVRIHANVSPNGFQRPLRIYIYLHSAHFAVMTAALKMTLPILSSWDIKDYDLIHQHYYIRVQIVSDWIKNS